MPSHGLCAGRIGTDGAVLSGSPREPGGGSSSSTICSRRALDRVARPQRGRRHRWDWIYCHSSSARVRRTVFGRITSARGDDRRLSNSEKRVPCDYLILCRLQNKSVTTTATL